MSMLRPPTVGAASAVALGAAGLALRWVLALRRKLEEQARTHAHPPPAALPARVRARLHRGWR